MHGTCDLKRLPLRPGDAMAVCWAKRDGVIRWLQQPGLKGLCPNSSQGREAGVIKDHPRAMSGNCFGVLEVGSCRLKLIQTANLLFQRHVE